jgi:hypothetical protein
VEDDGRGQDLQRTEVPVSGIERNDQRLRVVVVEERGPEATEELRERARAPRTAPGALEDCTRRACGFEERPGSEVAQCPGSIVRRR